VRGRRPEQGGGGGVDERDENSVNQPTTKPLLSVSGAVDRGRAHREIDKTREGNGILSRNILTPGKRGGSLANLRIETMLPDPRCG
jgi:hypothetical protein